MAAFVVVAPPPADGLPRTGMRVGIFPGSATPSVFPAGEPFWIGYGFVPEPGPAEESRSGALDRGTRFELEVDGEAVPLVTDVNVDDTGQALSKHSIANFESGLPAGWHRFSGRWYSGGQLVLTSDTSIQFVER
jgi:hypothetical protein